MEEEKKKTVVVKITVNVENGDVLKKFAKFSHYPRILNCLAYWIRFSQNLRARAAGVGMSTQRPPSPPTADELKDAELVLYRYIPELNQMKRFETIQFDSRKHLFRSF